MEEKKENKGSVFWKMFFHFLSILFPFFRMYVLNKQLELAEKTLGPEIKDKNGHYISPYDYFKRQQRRNTIISGLSIFPLLIGFALSYQILSTNQIFIKGINAAKKEIVKFRVIEAKNKMIIANKIDPSVNVDMLLSFYCISIGFFISFFNGLIIVYFHPIITETNKFKKYLAQSGYIKLEENSTVLATEIGFLMDIAGNTPREIADSDRIWIPLNIRVNKDWAENPEKRSLVFFKRAYELKKGADYGFNKIPK